MNRLTNSKLLLGSVFAALALALWAYGPVQQPAHYHDFADNRLCLGIAHGADVLSNLGFLLVGGLGLWRLWRLRRVDHARAALPAWWLFFISVVLTTFGSAYYHVAPDDLRLSWDRLPIALACASLIAALWSERIDARQGRLSLVPLLLFALHSVLWWIWTGDNGSGDLRPYLLLQLTPVMLMPLLLWRLPGAAAEDRALWRMVGLYVLAKLAELADAPIFELTGFISGHTLKHLLAALAAAQLLTLLPVTDKADRRLDSKTKQ